MVNASLSPRPGTSATLSPLLVCRAISRSARRLVSLMSVLTGNPHSRRPFFRHHLPVVQPKQLRRDTVRLCAISWLGSCPWVLGLQYPVVEVLVGLIKVGY